MKKTLLFVFAALLICVSVCFAQETAESINITTFLDVSSLGMSYDDLMAKFQDHYDSYHCEYSTEDNVLSCTTELESETHASQYLFLEDSLYGEVCSVAVLSEGYTKEGAIDLIRSTYNLEDFEPCDNAWLDNFVETTYTNVGYYTYAAPNVYLAMGSGDIIDNEPAMVFMALFDRELIDSL